MRWTSTWRSLHHMTYVRIRYASQLCQTLWLSRIILRACIKIAYVRGACVWPLLRPCRPLKWDNPSKSTAPPFPPKKQKSERKTSKAKSTFSPVNPANVSREPIADSGNSGYWFQQFRVSRQTFKVKDGMPAFLRHIHSSSVSKPIAEEHTYVENISSSERERSPSLTTPHLWSYHQYVHGNYSRLTQQSAFWGPRSP